MRTIAEIDAWYEAEMNKIELKGKLEGKIELASTIIRVKFGTDVLTPQIVNQLQELNVEQFDALTTAMLNWQQPLEMEEWLKGNVSRISKCTYRTITKFQ